MSEDRPSLKCERCWHGAVWWWPGRFAARCGRTKGVWTMRIDAAKEPVPHWCPRLPQPMLPGMMEVGR